jgi:hypothetical protein
MEPESSAEPVRPRLQIRFVDETEPLAHHIDAEVLAQALIHGQKALHLLALVAAGREFKERLRVPEELANEFKLVCEVPGPGSYLQNVLLEGTGAVLDVPSRYDVMEKFSQVGLALSEGSWDKLRQLVPDSRVRQRVVDEYALFLPNPESKFSVDVVSNGQPRATFRRPQIMAVREYSRSVRAQREFTASPVTIVGELITIDFGARTITVRQYSTNRRISCEYTDDVEDMLVKNRRGLIQVTGILELDQRDRPVRMTDVYDIQELDLSPVIVNSLDAPVGRLRFRSGAHSFSPVLDEEGHLLVVEDTSLDLHAYGMDRVTLVAEISEQLIFLWSEYVETNEPLTPGAAALADRLREVLEVVPHAK